MIDFINYFNEPYALLYRLKSDLSTTLLIMDESKISLAVIKYILDHIKESLSSFPIENKMINIISQTKKQIKKLIESQIIIVNDALNIDVRKFFKKINL